MILEKLYNPNIYNFGILEKLCMCKDEILKKLLMWNLGTTTLIYIVFTH